jgi:ubiquitin C-terminal hydrolase
LLGYVEQTDYPQSTCNRASLQNPANVCYLNALLHVLARVPLLYHWAVQHFDNTNTEHDKSVCCLCHLGSDLHRLSYSDHSHPRIAETVASRESWSNGLLAGARQQDVHEALQLLLTACQNEDEEHFKSICLDMPEILETYHAHLNSKAALPVLRLARGVTASVSRCGYCNSSNTIYDDWTSLELSVPAVSSTLEEILRLDFAPEPLEDVCEICCRQNERSRQTFIRRWPRVLIIYLKRRLGNRKVETEVIVGETLRPSESSPSYSLCGFVVHHGQHQGGHYVSVTRMADNQWYLCDDEVSPKRLSAASALKQEATLLVYQQA